MSFAVIHLNDIALLTSSDGVTLDEDAGVALLLDEGLKIGNDANDSKKLHPRKVNDNFWQSPSIEPLKAVPDYVRHHADLIYHHLTKIHQQLGEPDNIILAVPSSLNAEQLSYILGVADALPFEFSGLCDLAVAGAADSGLRGNILHYDLQQHQTVITSLESDRQAEKTDVIVAPNLGFNTIQNKWANIIADSFIEQSRFDPMHTAESEQHLFNQLPEWISQLTSSNDISIEFSTNQQTYEAKIERQQFITANDEFIHSILKKGQELLATPDHHLATHRLESLLTLSSLGNQFEILSARSVTRSIYENVSDIKTNSENLPLVTRLENTTSNTTSRSTSSTSQATIMASNNNVSTAARNTDSPTHLLVDNTASSLPISGNSINLVIENNHLITTSNSTDAIASISHANNQLVITSISSLLRLNNKNIDNTSTILESGDILTTSGGLTARVITVAN